MAKRMEALRYFQDKIQENAMDMHAHHNLAVLYKSMGDEAMYARHSRIALLTQVAGPKAWNEMGLVQMEQGKLDEARATFEQVIAQWPTFPCAYVNISAIYARRGQYFEALPYCERALQLQPNDPALYRNIAKVNENMGRANEALHYYQRALALAPGDAVVAKRIALMSLSRGQTAVSTAYYNHYRALHGEHFDLKL
ncbi:TPA: hypothetical protein N0F65_012339 [Lagenidium giganteum]|uniref:Uncharacterized protein n=1 Tax=Lagenidium giganteum TaxID=4803 RepID=A0AAV2YU48_9STRA|nr:TPA: hypothetical protein N0F65_012339 [Lagenidium giganteum]